MVHSAAALLALALGLYCLLAAAVLSAQPAAGTPDPQELAARERHLWPGLVPVLFLALVAGYAILIAARRRRPGRERPGPPSTQDPPPTNGRRRDTASR